MVKIPRENPYHLYLRWCIQRDQLNAHFLRFGSGFITANNMREAMDLVKEVNQNLIQVSSLKEGEHNQLNGSVERSCTWIQSKQLW